MYLRNLQVMCLVLNVLIHTCPLKQDVLAVWRNGSFGGPPIHHQFLHGFSENRGPTLLSFLQPECILSCVQDSSPINTSPNVLFIYSQNRSNTPCACER